jgi:hypothetical protein
MVGKATDFLTRSRCYQGKGPVNSRIGFVSRASVRVQVQRKPGQSHSWDSLSDLCSGPVSGLKNRVLGGQRGFMRRTRPFGVPLVLVVVDFTSRNKYQIDRKNNFGEQVTRTAVGFEPLTSPFEDHSNLTRMRQPTVREPVEAEVYMSTPLPVWQL